VGAASGEQKAEIRGQKPEDGMQKDHETTDQRQQKKQKAKIKRRRQRYCSGAAEGLQSDGGYAA
jgi:hypothetical protein